MRATWAATLGLLMLTAAHADPRPGDVLPEFDIHEFCSAIGRSGCQREENQARLFFKAHWNEIPPETRETCTVSVADNAGAYGGSYVLLKGCILRQAN